MADARPLYSTVVDQWLLANFPTAKGAKDAYDAFSASLYGSEVDEDDEGDNDVKCDSSDEEDRKAVELALTWHATSNPPPLLERYLGLGLRSSEGSATSEARPAAAIIPTHDTGSASRTADVSPSPATLLERMSCGNASKLEWRSSPRTDQREEFLRRTARGQARSVLQELPTNRPTDRNPKDAKVSNETRGGSRGPPPWTTSSYRRSDDSVRNHGPGRDLRYDQPRRGGGSERSGSTALPMPPRRSYAAARNDTPQPPRRPTSGGAPSAPQARAPPSSPQPAQVSREASRVPAELRVSTSQETQLVQSPHTPESYLRLATDPASRGLMARIYKLVAIAYMYRAGSVRMQHDINALCVAYQATDPEVASRFNPPPEWHEAMVQAFLPKMLVEFAEEATRDVANELLETIVELEKAIEDGLQPPPLRKYLVVALILYIEHLIQFGAETIEQMKGWPRHP